MSSQQAIVGLFELHSLSRSSKTVFNSRDRIVRPERAV